MRSFERNRYRYTARFCEENIWWLASSLAEEGCDLASMMALFISNPDKSALLMAQQAASPGQAVLWDYHVVLHLQGPDRPSVFDFDSRLPFPTAAADWFASSFPLQSSLPPQYRTWIRQVPAAHLLQHFYSDRSHMRGVVPQSEFPPDPIICPAQPADRIALSEYHDMGLTIADCPISNLEELLATGSLT